MRKGHNGLVGKIVRATDARTALCSDEDQFFLESDDRGEVTPLEWLGYENCLELVIVELAKKRSGRSGLKFHVRLWIRCVVTREDGGQPHAGSTLQRAQAQGAVYDPTADFVLGLVGKSQQLLGVPEQ